jgi:hypothetical protein
VVDQHVLLHVHCDVLACHGGSTHGWAGAAHKSVQVMQRAPHRRTSNRSCGAWSLHSEANFMLEQHAVQAWRLVCAVRPPKGQLRHHSTATQWGKPSSSTSAPQPIKDRVCACRPHLPVFRCSHRRTSVSTG